VLAILPVAVRRSFRLALIVAVASALTADLVLDERREIARGIHPAVLAEGGLGPAFKALAGRAGVPVELGRAGRAAAARTDRGRRVLHGL
jgi:hypothetical protein